MRWVALLPLRGGSKSIPLKNLKPIAGRGVVAFCLPYRPWPDEQAQG